MTPSVLGSVTLGYELLWNQKRRCCGVRLFVDSPVSSTLDARHLLAALAELWPDTAPNLLLQVRDPSLLAGLLALTPPRSLWLELTDTQLANTTLANSARQAHARGLPLVWSGEAGHAPSANMAKIFHKTLRALTPHQALAALRTSQQPGAPSPVVAGSIYEGLASPALLEHSLDRQGAWAVAGWPVDEILHAYRLKQIQPSRQLLRGLVAAIEADESLDVLEHRMGEEPLLVYRFLRYANSAHLGARCEVTTVRQGLMVMGYSKLRNWLLEQTQQASTDANLDPIRCAMVLRARIMEHLSEAGLEDALRSEVFLCGVLSQLDLLLGEPLGAAIHRLPLPGRIASAVVGDSGPYAPWLAVASALESSNTRMVREVCRAHKMPADMVNRALLRTLAKVGG
ncbi:HDOD domain-containing protein [Rhodoferax sp. AJA081-3]|uniref:HDOD domain-containing protein n=1 Tax=Rhodoferax sp. AJA081-3 TaxID=2752316 RepID=UPI001AE0D400|nr:HDOD domain-containing protein [Rhodoferax sp. AJA081-3]QTN30291.1 HDOD domain-containing protein [Rhodoferax sp. AJA081-3]